MDAVFKHWSDKGLTTIRDLYIDNHVASFAQLQAKFKLPTNQFFRYLQIRNFVKQSFSCLDATPVQHDFFDIMTRPPTSKHLISRLVSLFVMATPSFHIKEAWTKDIGEVISDELWVKGLNRIKACSINARLQLVQFKVVHWLHYSKTRLNRIFPDVSPTCDRCSAADGTLGYLFWSCPMLTKFWVDIFSLYSVVYNRQMVPDSLLVILGCSNDSLSLPHTLQQALMFGMIIAKRVILKEWKSAAPPCFKRWLNDMVSCLYLEEVRFSLSTSQDKFEKIWGPYISYINKDRSQTGT